MPLSQLFQKLRSKTFKNGYNKKEYINGINIHKLWECFMSNEELAKAFASINTIKKKDDILCGVAEGYAENNHSKILEGIPTVLCELYKASKSPKNKNFIILIVGTFKLTAVEIAMAMVELFQGDKKPLSLSNVINLLADHIIKGIENKKNSHIKKQPLTKEFRSITDDQSKSVIDLNHSQQELFQLQAEEKKDQSRQYLVKIKQVQGNIVDMQTKLREKEEEIKKNLEEVDKNSAQYKLFSCQLAQTQRELDALKRKINVGWHRFIVNNSTEIMVIGSIGILVSPWIFAIAVIVNLVGKHIRKSLERQCCKLETELDSLKTEAILDREKNTGIVKKLNNQLAEYQDLKKVNQNNNQKLEEASKINMEGIETEGADKIKMEACIIQGANTANIKKMCDVLEIKTKNIIENQEESEKLICDVNNAKSDVDAFKRQLKQLKNQMYRADYITAGGGAFALGSIISGSLYTGGLVGFGAIASLVIVNVAKTVRDSRSIETNNSANVRSSVVPSAFL